MAPVVRRDVARLTKQFRALAEPTRLEIIDALRRGERCVCELTDSLGIAQPLLSFHLKTLRDAGLLRDRRDGRWAYYSLDAESFAQLEAFVGGLPSTKLSVLASRCCG